MSAKDLVVRAFDGFDGTPSSIERLLGHCADDLVFRMAPTDESHEWRQWKGKKPVHEFMLFAYGQGRDLRRVPRHLVAEGDTVVYAVTNLATQNAELHGYPANARTRTEMVYIIQVRDERIAEVTMHVGPHLFIEGDEEEA
ncbi:MAG: ester cyclase [Chloroflexi bacterium]|nr:ester cyclase [Chloroflexota bacterium]MCZ7576930.1 ester cyclase [Dehalococcoidia bacterium]